MTDNCGHEPCCQGGADLLRGDLSAPALALAAAGFAALWRGHALHPDEIVPGKPDLAIDTVKALVGRGRAEVDADGRLIGVHGLTMRTTRHRFFHNEKARNTWCAFDSIGIPAALELDAVAHTDCPTCNRQLEVVIDGGQPRGDDYVLWLPAAQGTHLMTEFCATADLFCSIDHLRRHIDTTTAGRVVDLATAASLGQATWADVRMLER